MSDALISVPVAVSFWTISGITLGYASSKLKKSLDTSKIVPYMGVMGAFVFALQMVNFSIPGTGSSGHFTGGFLLAILLGSDAAFLVITSVLLIQSLLFADGGLMALGCNIFNMGFIPAYVVYPLLKNKIGKNNLFIWFGAFISLMIGAFMVSMQTGLSGLAELPFIKMLTLMLTIHFFISIVEGLITVGSYSFIKKYTLNLNTNTKTNNLKPYLGIIILSVIIAGGLSLLASSNPDGLEWSVFNIIGNGNEPTSLSGQVHTFFTNLQEKISILPDYNFKDSGNIGTSIAGIIGAVITMALAFSIGLIIKRKNKN
jgi:cobalt/nickel transport system permease protein